jgi:membrane-associated protease RseP (regulator of RpoE activity)
MSVNETISDTIPREAATGTPQIASEATRRLIHPPKSSVGITPHEWRIHIGLFALTTMTAILAGTMLVAPEVAVAEPPLRNPIDYILYLPLGYLNSVAALIQQIIQDPSLLLQGVAFASSLLSILFAHEMGHYLACRHYGVDATLPFFIPAPPLFLAGTFGAFIKIRSPIPSRRALFDIGLAGPLAGFIVAIPVTIIGLMSLQPGLGQGFGIVFNDPMFFRIAAKVLRIPLDPYSPINPYYMAAWIGLLVTSLNLMPVGQLDGGHGTFAAFGATAHRIIGRVAFGVVVILALLGFWLHGSPSGFLYAVLLGIMLRVRHPQPPMMEPLGMKRVVIAIITLLVFALCFVPFPITIH